MAKATKKKHPTDGILQELRAFGMAYPGAHFKSPWPGHMDLAVNDKTFAYLSLEGEPLGISCKLPRSSDVALMLPFCKPTGYGLGKSGWVSASFDDADVDVAMLKAWIDESYRAQAPKKLVASLGAPVTGDGATATAPAPAGKAKPAKRVAAAGGAKPAKRAAPAGDAKQPARRATSLRPPKRAAAKAR
jgi:predicted DNA-binding protein (MmcQ/YjbR family)